MSNWDVLIDESALASVLPEVYARYRPPVRSALAAFLAGLPPGDQEAVLADQAALPWTASPERRLAALAQSCPALQKLGQVAARDRRLSAEVREHLQALESLPASVPLDAIRQTLDRELGPLESRGVTLLPPAIAEASVAVVIPVRYDRPPSGVPPREGVFKLLKPGIEERLEHELRLLEAVGTLLDARCDEFQIPHLDYHDAFEQVRSKLGQEIRLDLEQQHLQKARDFFRGDPTVLVPEPFPELC
ncbi:MAG: AarF/UbiB family protein, partial [Isosphaeraceae bacterium]